MKQNYHQNQSFTQSSKMKIFQMMIINVFKMFGKHKITKDYHDI